jgi:SagB-type dehydrogenase family enzyme
VIDDSGRIGAATAIAEAAMHTAAVTTTHGRNLGGVRYAIVFTMIQTTKVTVGSEWLTLAELYHHGSSYPPRFTLSGGVWRQRPPLYTRYPDAPTVTLDPADATGGPPMLEACRRWHTPIHQLEPASIDLPTLAALLYDAQGISGTLQLGGGRVQLRTAPSAGALYPVDLYIAASRVDGLEPGLYHYQVADHTLEQLTPGDLLPSLEAASASPHLLRNAAATVLVAVSFARSGAKYRERCYRYVNMDAGHAAANLGAAAQAFDLAAPLISRFADSAINALVGLEPREQAVLALMPVGDPTTDADAPPASEPAFALDSELAQPATTNFLELIHDGSSLVLDKGSAPPPTTDDPPPAGRGSIQLPEPPAGEPVLPCIQRRRSHRQFGKAPLTLEQMASLIAASTPTGNGPFTTRAPRLQLYAAVRAVHGTEPGLYIAAGDGRSLVPRRRGTLTAELYTLAFRQGLCASAQVVFVVATTWPELLAADGDRGYRTACLRSGILGNALYLQATALGLGACGVGAFSDDRALRLIASSRGESNDHELVLYLVAVGA